MRLPFVLCLAAAAVAGSVELAEAARPLHVTRYRAAHGRYHVVHRFVGGPAYDRQALAVGAALGLFGAGIAGATDAVPPGYGYYGPGYHGPGFGTPGY